MGALELLMVGIFLPMLYLTATKVGFNYQVVGQSLDVLGIPGVRNQLLQNADHVNLMQRIVRRYLFLTKTFPVVLLCVGMLCTALYLSLKGSAVSGEAVSMWWLAFCSLVIGGVLMWLITFDPAPDWLYETHILVLLAKSKIDLEVIHAALCDIEGRAIGELSDDELNLVRMQCTLLRNLAKEVEATVTDLEHQRRELNNSV